MCVWSFEIKGLPEERSSHSAGRPEQLLQHRDCLCFRKVWRAKLDVPAVGYTSLTPGTIHRGGIAREQTARGLVLDMGVSLQFDYF